VFAVRFKHVEQGSELLLVRGHASGTSRKSSSNFAPSLEGISAQFPIPAADPMCVNNLVIVSFHSVRSKREAGMVYISRLHNLA
jgi:hypothetical protein